MPGTDLLIVLVLLALAPLLFVRRGPKAADEAVVEEDIVVDLEFLRARPAELEQRISELAALSGGASLGARMWMTQLAAKPGPEPEVLRSTHVRRRARPLVASR